MGSITGYVLKAMMTSSILMLGFVSTEPFFQHTKYRRGLAAACPNSLGSKQTLITSQEECGRWLLTTSSPYSGTFSMICTVNSLIFGHSVVTFMSMKSFISFTELKTHSRILPPQGGPRRGFHAWVQSEVCDAHDSSSVMIHSVCFFHSVSPLGV